jgi:hypothetical protein
MKTKTYYQTPAPTFLAMLRENPAALNTERKDEAELRQRDVQDLKTKYETSSRGKEGVR